MANSSIHPAIQMARPRETRQALGQWIRLTRQRLRLTQPLLASKSGVSVSSLSRMEREGQGAVDHLLRVLQALGELDGFHAHVQELLRKASLPWDLSEIKKPTPPRQRVRLPQPPKVSS